MPEEKKERKPDGPICDHALVCPEDWDDPEARRVLGEYHKETAPKVKTGVEADLERFEEFWSNKGHVNVQSAYHKHGAPYVEEIDGRNSRDVQAEVGAETAGVEPESGKAEGAGTTVNPFSGRQIDLATIEIITYALSRALFAGGVKVPIKKDGMVDMDITLKGKDIYVNTNQFYAAIPELSVWRIVYTHQEKPIFEFGRGVKKGMKVHRLNALKLGMSLWMQTRAAAKAKAKLKKQQDLEMRKGASQ